MIDVVLFNDSGCELSRERGEDMSSAGKIVMSLLESCTIEAGDTIKFEEVL